MNEGWITIRPSTGEGVLHPLSRAPFLVLDGDVGGRRPGPVYIRDGRTLAEILVALDMEKMPIRIQAEDIDISSRSASDMARQLEDRIMSDIGSAGEIDKEDIDPSFQRHPFSEFQQALEAIPGIVADHVIRVIPVSPGGIVGDGMSCLWTVRLPAYPLENATFAQTAAEDLIEVTEEIDVVRLVSRNCITEGHGVKGFLEALRATPEGESHEFRMALSRAGRRTGLARCSPSP